LASSGTGGLDDAEEEGVAAAEHDEEEAGGAAVVAVAAAAAAVAAAALKGAARLQLRLQQRRKDVLDHAVHGAQQVPAAHCLSCTSRADRVFPLPKA
jgi:hypothetical protein